MMADWRKLHSKICENEELGECSIGANLLFERLLIKTDDEGRFYGNPIIINKLVFTARKDIKNSQIDKWLVELTKKELIQPYIANKKKYLYFLNFHKYQQLRKDIKPKIYYPTPPVTDSERPVTDSLQPVDIRGEEKRGEERRGRGFAPPTNDELKTYCTENNLSIQTQRFLDFYSSKGWMVGKNKMKDWKAAVRNWASRDEKPKIQIPQEPIIKHTKQDIEHYDPLGKRGKK